MGFAKEVVKGVRLIREAIQSVDFVSGTSGWSINKDGTAEFQDATIRGDIIASTLTAGPPGGSQIIVDPDVQIGFDSGFLEAVVRMMPDDPAFMMEGMLGVVVFDQGAVNATMASILHSPIMDEGYGIVLSSMADDSSRDAHGAMGPVDVSGEAMTFTGVHMFEKYGMTTPAFLSYSSTPGQVIQTFQTPGVFNWTAPPGVTSVKAECWGGGGRGGPKTGGGGGGGGGGGEYNKRPATTVTPGNTYVVTVGAGSNTAGVDGADSTFVSDINTTIGHGGKTSLNSNAAAGGTGAAAGTHFDGGSGGSTVFTGGGGGGGAAGTSQVGGLGNPGDLHGFGGAGGVGGTTGGGNGGKGGTLNGVQGLPGSSPGGGGGGQGAGTSVGPGAGANGQVRLTYTPTIAPLAASMAAMSGTDRFGNVYPGGFSFGGKTVPDSSLFQFLNGVASSVQALSTTRTDVTGMTVTFTTKNPNAIALIMAQWDVTVSAGVAGTGNVSVGEVMVDGSLQTPIAVGQESATERESFAIPAFSAILAVAGSHTIKGTIRKNGTATAAISAGNGSQITVLVFDFFS